MASQFVDTSPVSTDTDDQAEPTLRADVVVKGRNVEIPDHFRIYVSQKLSRLERLDRSVYLFDVELKHARNRRQRKSCQQVEITARGRGPVVRGEARADSFYAAFEAAVDRLESRLRRGNDRRKVHYGDKRPVSVFEATAATAAPEPSPSAWDVDATRPHQRDGVEVDTAFDGTDREPGRIVRTKEHAAVPMSVDDALYEMELVGHDFFLFFDKESERPSVVYRRHGYDYGLIRLA
ncbi:ribosome hibernation-promoting factor, HPF/YfiA family [Mycobacterium talmoniae]|uniref:Ribosome hibernation promoting factor n=1 Tax=Mycobacterium talmoniae TaxID=1858794 RepID=A0A1S1NIF4_9MYCO|nr:MULTISPECIES: ribosome-associated translation inhibitor RaiA [Mycobacterium]OHV03628.1 ribosomal subunit interface protein [Mycobacterium talmoniae]TDH53394.1 ribosome-associated translation inhibitor RaiA [Mycobacterium eburneum]